MSNRRTVFEHKGYKLRSYTELMWARLMDAIDVFYLYEPDLIQVEGCKYLPDFYLPAADIYLEVKGTHPTEVEKSKAEQAHIATGRPVVFLVARPQSDRGGFMNCELLMPAKGGWFRGSLHDLDQMYLSAAGDAAWTKAILSVREDDLDYVRHASDVLDELLQVMSGRSSMESHLRMHHMRINQQRSRGKREISIAEKGIKFWRDRYFPKGTNPGSGAGEGARVMP